MFAKLRKDVTKFLFVLGSWPMPIAIVLLAVFVGVSVWSHHFGRDVLCVVLTVITVLYTLALSWLIAYLSAWVGIINELFESFGRHM